MGAIKKYFKSTENYPLPPPPIGKEKKTDRCF
jgi:hypothetical protein